jgi:hypothetical protein
MNKGILSLGLIAGLTCFANSQAGLIQCSEDSSKNHMLIDSGLVAACLASGVGNINGNPGNDPFLTDAGAGYELASKSDGTNLFDIDYTQGEDPNKGLGTWSFDAAFWDTYEFGAIGFKFGTGNKPDMWFIYELLPGVTGGLWEFVNVFGKGGGLSHVNLYGILGDITTIGDEPPPIITTNSVPEPATAGLMLASLGLLGMSMYRRRREIIA